MKKMTMDLDQLAVESFEVGSMDPDARGTVRGREARDAAAISVDFTLCRPGCLPTVVAGDLTDAL